MVCKFAFVVVDAWVDEPVWYLYKDLMIDVTLQERGDGVATVDLPVVYSGESEEDFQDGYVGYACVGFVVVATANEQVAFHHDTDFLTSVSLDLQDGAKWNGADSNRKLG